jgi:hypothetical protein
MVSLTLHLAVESAASLDSAWSQGQQALSVHTHEEEDHFTHALTQEDRQSNSKDFAILVVDPGGISRSIIPQLPPPKQI